MALATCRPVSPHHADHANKNKGGIILRIWHKDLIEVLPRQQLLGQWRELSAMAKNIVAIGTPNHILVNRLLDYPITHFLSYAKYIRREMLRRGYSPAQKTYDDILSVSKLNDFEPIDMECLFYNWHTPRYLEQCLRNLEEKAMCGGISSYEWAAIFDEFVDKIDLWRQMR